MRIYAKKTVQDFGVLGKGETCGASKTAKLDPTSAPSRPSSATWAFQAVLQALLGASRAALERSKPHSKRNLGPLGRNLALKAAL